MLFSFDGFTKMIENDSALISKQNLEFESLVEAGIKVIFTNPAKTRELILQAINKNQTIDTMQRMRALNIIGTTYQLQASYSKAMDYYYEGLQYSKKGKDNLYTGHLYNNLGSSHIKIGNHKEALEYYLMGLRVYTQIKNMNYAASSHNNIGLMYMDLANYQKALEHYKIALQVRDIGDSIGMAATYSNIGTLFLNQGNIDSAFYYYEISIALDLKTENKYGLSVGYQAIAEAYQEIGKYNKAIEYYNKSRSIAKEINHHYQIALADIGLSDVALEKDNPQTAIMMADSAFNIAKTLQNLKLMQETHEMYSKIFTQTKDYKKALDNYRASVELKDSLINQTKLHQIYNLEIDQLSMAQELQKLEIQRQQLQLSKKNNIIIFIVVAFILTLAGIYLLYINYNHRRKANMQKTILSLTEKKSRAAAEAEIQERKRIGQELHDGLGQMLSVARLNISVLQQKRALSDFRKNELIDSALHSVDEAFYELRNISHNLAPSVLSSKGLATALKELVDQVNQSKHIKIQLEMYGINGSMDDIIENTLYRASQELISNTIKHSNASQFFMQLVKSEKEITMMVEDNGHGFDLENTLIRHGGGLSNIRSRVENLGGNIFIDSMKNRGTIISVMVPLKKPDYAGQSN